MCYSIALPGAPSPLTSSASCSYPPIAGTPANAMASERYPLMDAKMDVDLGKVPEPPKLSPTTEPASIPTLDGWIESLMNCKQLAENDVQRLCDRVRQSCGIG